MHQWNVQCIENNIILKPVLKIIFNFLLIVSISIVLMKNYAYSSIHNYISRLLRRKYPQHEI